jgi:hypothetical protein
MHWRTFNRICDAIQAQERRKDDAFIIGAAALLDRIGWPPPDLDGPPAPRRR